MSDNNDIIMEIEGRIGEKEEELTEEQMRAIAYAYENEIYDYFYKEIDPKIPTYFYFVMAAERGGEYFTDDHRFAHDDKGNLVRDENGKYIKTAQYYDLQSSICGWYEAFKRTCDKLDMQWLLDYHASLDWPFFEELDGLIEARIGVMCEALDTEIGKI